MADQSDQLQHALKGFSGYKLEILRNDHMSFVRKSAQHAAQNTKLRAEVEKLARLAALSRDSALFSVPRVLNQDTTKTGLAYYDLEFVPSWELAARLPHMEPHKIQTAAEQIFAIIRALAAETGTRKPTPPSADFIAQKLQETAQAIQPLSGQMDAFCDQLIAHFLSICAELELPPAHELDQTSFCHGDLALDNVLLDRNNHIYLIDPLANGHESFMWDIAKVFQSSLGNWQHIKHGDFTLDEDHAKIIVQAHHRVALFNAHFAQQVSQVYSERVVLLYLGTTLARVIKYWQTREQLCALLILTNNVFERYHSERYVLHEPLSALCR